MKKIYILLLLPVLITGCSLNFTQKRNPIQNTEETNRINTISSEKIYYITCNNNQCSIPRASGLPDDTNCIWNYVSGNGSIPYSEVTLNGMHILNHTDAIWDVQVLCTDLNGKIYFGKEGEERK
jgi:hypothetical protein